MNSSDMLLIYASIASSLMIITSSLIRSHKRREIKYPLSVDTEYVELDEIRKYLNTPLKGLVPDYGKSGKLIPVKLTVPLIPKELSNVWYCRKLGCGGWGCAYLCKDEKGNEVVFKVPKGLEGLIEGGEVPTVSIKAIKRIHKEVKIITKLRHPNILRLLGYGLNTPILIYEFANFGSLYWQLSKGWKPSLRDVILIGMQVGDALRYIHGRGLVHGDIKPSNIFIKDGVVKVGDFSSIVKLASQTTPQSSYGFTLGFRAPEQVFYDLRKLSSELGIESRIDTYQLGNLLLYLLTGRSIDGEDITKSQIVNEVIKDVDYPPLRKVIIKALEPMPTKRPSCEEVVRRLLKIYYRLK